MTPTQLATMTPATLEAATVPTFYFVGVTTGKSSIMQVFPKWAAHLGLGDCPIRGIDCVLHDEPENYRKVVDFLKNDALSLGGLVTSHKLDLLKASRDMFEVLDPYAQRLGEISSISKQGGNLVGHAKDPITAGLSLDAIAPEGYWQESGADLCLLGAGGSSLALTMDLMQRGPEADRPQRIFVTNRSPARIEEMKAIHAEINNGIELHYSLCPTAEGNDAIVAKLKPGSVIANATGLGKDAPGSPLSDAVVFPERAKVWDFNYRGDLLFLDQARDQEEAKDLHIEDGWFYFLHGWTRVIAEVFHIDIPTSGPEFDKLSDIAASTRS